MSTIVCEEVSEECGYSFADLYEAAFGHKPDAHELSELYALSQQERNRVVGEWARKAGWGTKDRLGGDGAHYTAFCPLWEQD